MKPVFRARCLTVGDLRQLISKLPDGADVVISVNGESLPVLTVRVFEPSAQVLGEGAVCLHAQIWGVI